MANFTSSNIFALNEKNPAIEDLNLTDRKHEILFHTCTGY
jgi:hypothetical protein